ncbi:MAG: hypothetical protein B7X07_04945 [Actinobacteria bacterium 21-64-8]|nr:MAG: hypothetical protein B7X07_04945 [Actinobacteria bacterium 21-64-8]
MVTQVRTPAALQGSKRLIEGSIQLLALDLVESTRGRTRINASAKEHLVAEEVAHARDDRLV